MTYLMQFLHELFNTYFAMAPYLVLGLVFAGFLHVLFRRDIVERHLGGRGFLPVLKAAILGVPLPLCSCGVVPTALSLRKSRASEGATVSFLISTPVTGVDSIMATWGMMGPVFAIFRPLAAFAMGIVGGMLTDATSKDEERLAGDVAKTCPLCGRTDRHTHTIVEKLQGMYRYAFGEFLDDIAGNLVIGFVLAALIAWLLPDSFFTVFAGNVWLEMLVALIGGIPLYVCATASIPIAAALMLKGLSPAAAFVFLAAGPATNAATILLISRVMGMRVTAIYLATISAGSMIFGWLLGVVFGFSGGFNKEMLPCHNQTETFSWNFMTIIAVLFAIPLTMALCRRYVPKKAGLKKAGSCSCEGESCQSSNNTSIDNSRHFSIVGMTCHKCVAHVTSSIKGVDGVTGVAIDLATGACEVSGNFSDEEVKNAVAGAGYRVGS